MKNFKINKKTYNNNSKVYYIADIAANHDGNLERAKNWSIFVLKQEQMQQISNFKADTIVSDFGFKQLKNKLSHQSKWKKSVFQVYEDASIPQKMDWYIEKTCEKTGIDISLHLMIWI